MERPKPVAIPGVALRPFQAADVEIWLTIRHQAFDSGPISARKWSADDFRAEFLDRWWWRPERMWFAEAAGAVVGTVTLGERGRQGESRPVVHWLAVLPAWRRRGVGRLLVAHVEGLCWDAGQRQIWLETHEAWREAVRLYRALGYVDA